MPVCAAGWFKLRRFDERTFARQLSTTFGVHYRESSIYSGTGIGLLARRTRAAPMPVVICRNFSPLRLLLLARRFLRARHTLPYGGSQLTYPAVPARFRRAFRCPFASLRPRRAN
jgi:hypothetical protein